MRPNIHALLLLAALGSAAPTAAQNLVNNGSFESPQQRPGGYTDFAVGNAGIPGWEIVGVSNTFVTIVDEGYAGNAGFSFPAQQGSQWIDLAGFSDNAPNGVRQSVATTVNSAYLLSFYVGNVTGGPDNAFGTQSGVGVEFGSGGTDFSCTNTASGSTLTWKRCSQRFVATSDSTMFTLRNLDPRSDFSNAVDNVSLTLVGSSGGVPEPATWAMLLIGFGATGAVMRRRPARKAAAAAN